MANLLSVLTPSSRCVCRLYLGLRVGACGVCGSVGERPDTCLLRCAPSPLSRAEEYWIKPCVGSEGSGMQCGVYCALALTKFRHATQPYFLGVVDSGNEEYGRWCVVVHRMMNRWWGTGQLAALTLLPCTSLDSRVYASLQEYAAQHDTVSRNCGGWPSFQTTFRPLAGMSTVYGVCPVRIRMTSAMLF